MRPQPHVPHPIPHRNKELRRLLEAQRAAILQDLRVRMHDVRTEADAESGEVRDEADASRSDLQTDLEMALLQMQRETLMKIDAALHELDEHRYGRCRDCGCEIATTRLRALPFAIRCTACEDTHEAGDRRRPVKGDWRRVVRELDAAA